MFFEADFGTSITFSVVLINSSYLWLETRWTIILFHRIHFIYISVITVELNIFYFNFSFLTVQQQKTKFVSPHYIISLRRKINDLHFLKKVKSQQTKSTLKTSQFILWASITLILKSKTEQENYIPVSLINIGAKILSKYWFIDSFIFTSHSTICDNDDLICDFFLGEVFITKFFHERSSNCKFKGRENARIFSP